MPSEASLIAAAPDLLTCAQELRAAQRAYLADRGNDALGQAVASAAVRLDSAIAKAEDRAALSKATEGGER